MLDLFPQGFEEVDRADRLELAAYTDADGERALRKAFGDAVADEVEPGWEDRWREFHRPVRIGRLWIGPPWEQPPPDAVAVVIDPGRAFGTGGHPTTRLSLELLCSLEPAGLLDVGCGSGVLSIAAAKLGFRPVVAVDADLQAVEVTVVNAAANGVEVAACHADALSDELPPAEIVVANIAREVVEALAARLDCAVLVTSGYLASDPAGLPPFKHVRRTVADGWAADLHER